MRTPNWYGKRPTIKAIPTDPSCSPDGRRIRLSVEENKHPKIWEVNIDGSHAHRLLAEGTRMRTSSHGRWTADGKHFIFQSNLNGRNNLSRSIEPGWLMFWKKPTAAKLTSGEIEVVDAIPSRDGHELFMMGRPRPRRHAECSIPNRNASCPSWEDWLRRNSLSRRTNNGWPIRTSPGISYGAAGWMEARNCSSPVLMPRGRAGHLMASPSCIWIGGDLSDFQRGWDSGENHRRRPSRYRRAGMDPRWKSNHVQ